MEKRYQVNSTSRQSAQVSDIWLAPPDDPENAYTRRVLRPLLVENQRDGQSPVKTTIVHQRRHSRSEPWEDVDAFNLATLKGGQEVRLTLDCAETKHLFRALGELYQLASDGVPQGDQTYVVAKAGEALLVKGKARHIIQDLLQEGNDELWNEIAEVQPSLFRALMLQKLHELREQAVRVFGAHLEAGDWSEDNWQEFFEANTWIFGLALRYRFLQTVQNQPDYGGRTLSGVGTQRGDFLMATEAEARFTVLVEIKKPSSLLVGREYRNGAHLIGADLAGGIAQLQANCRVWERDGSRQEDNVDRLRGQAIHTYQPKGILVIGHTNQLDSREKLATFELFRGNLHNPEVITFDELLARANALLLNTQEQARSRGIGHP
jgi:hypothetical protein